MSAFFFLSDIYKETIIMSDKNNKNRLRKKSAPSYSEIPSGDVHPSILGGATDTAQTSKDADANIANVTKGAKNNIRKFLNNDFPINYSGGFRTVVVGLRQLLKLRYKGGSNYAKYQTPNGIFSFRLSDHNANGNNFENSEINISVYVAYHEYDVPESEVKYTEYKITPQLFENNPQSVVSAIVNGISKALNGESFSLDDSIATGDSFPKETPIENNKTDKNESKNMNRKNTIRLTESELKNVITESVKNILKEGALDVISNVKSKDDKKKVGDLTRRVLNPQDINNAFNKIERVLDEISYLNDPRISIHYLENLRKKTQSLKQEFSMVTSNLGGSVANHFANPWSQDRRTFKYKPTNNLPFDDAEPEDWYERNEHGDFDEF